MDRPVSDLVATHSACALVLERYQIDYCSEGHRTLLAACDKHRLDPARILFQCDAAIHARENPSVVDPAQLSTKQLVLAVLARHHRYLHESLPLLAPLAARTAEHHGERHPKLHAIASLVQTLATTMLEHIAEEEHGVLRACAKENAPLVRYLLATTYAEHRGIVASLRLLRELCDDFVCPDTACAEYKVLFAELCHLERDTSRHVEIENDVLFRRFSS